MTEWNKLKEKTGIIEKVEIGDGLYSLTVSGEKYTFHGPSEYEGGILICKDDSIRIKYDVEENGRKVVCGKPEKIAGVESPETVRDWSDLKELAEETKEIQRQAIKLTQENLDETGITTPDSTLDDDAFTSMVDTAHIGLQKEYNRKLGRFRGSY